MEPRRRRARPPRGRSRPRRRRAPRARRPPRARAPTSRPSTVTTTMIPTGATGSYVRPPQSPTSRPEPSTFARLSVGGTFDRMHAGHRFCWRRPPRAPPGKAAVFVGVTGDKLLVNKRYRQLVQAYDDRAAAAETFLRATRGPTAAIELHVGPLDAGLPLAATVRDMDALVVSRETRRRRHVNAMEGRARVRAARHRRRGPRRWRRGRDGGRETQLLRAQSRGGGGGGYIAPRGGVRGGYVGAREKDPGEDERGARVRRRRDASGARPPRRIRRIVYEIADESSACADSGPESDDIVRVDSFVSTRRRDTWEEVPPGLSRGRGSPGIETLSSAGSRDASSAGSRDASSAGSRDASSAGSRDASSFTPHPARHPSPRRSSLFSPFASRLSPGDAGGVRPPPASPTPTSRTPPRWLRTPSEAPSAPPAPPARHPLRHRSRSSRLAARTRVSFVVSPPPRRLASRPPPRRRVASPRRTRPPPRESPPRTSAGSDDSPTPPSSSREAFDPCRPRVRRRLRASARHASSETRRRIAQRYVRPRRRQTAPGTVPRE